MENYITKEGKEKLEKELSYLKNAKRKEVAQRIRGAAAMGDLSENFDYQSAKEEQDMTERRIAELETTLAMAEEVGESSASGQVQVGSKVTLETEGKKWTIALTGPQEADPLKDKISASSPLGQALLGKKRGDKIEVDTPQGMQSYIVLDIA